ncbi:hypothetical protein AO370_0268 [Moraxella catarrhalis]|uniref:Uncharacterized protein n=1 Tax=Moraxella catarrhalis TaxID=480 RepID=A0AB36DR73_MORCA|nr:hypothetical protein AO370_0268 [Moraxella catarrhalis]
MYADHYVIWLNNSIQTINLDHQKRPLMSSAVFFDICLRY